VHLTKQDIRQSTLIRASGPFIAWRASITPQYLRARPRIRFAAAAHGDR